MGRMEPKVAAREGSQPLSKLLHYRHKRQTVSLDSGPEG